MKLLLNYRQTIAGWLHPQTVQGFFNMLVRYRNFSCADARTYLCECDGRYGRHCAPAGCGGNSIRILRGSSMDVTQCTI